MRVSRRAARRMSYPGVAASPDTSYDDARKRSAVVGITGMISRRRLLVGSAGTFASIGILRFPAGAAEFSYKLGNDSPPTHPENLRLRAMADKIKSDTNGRFEIQLFPNNQLGGDTAMLSQVRSGAIQFVVMPDNVLANVVPVAAISNIGFAFEDAKRAFASMDGPLGSLIRDEVAKTGLYAFAREWNNGFRQITTSTKPITSPDDLTKFKIRVPESPIAVSMFRALGSSPTAINFNEVYTALQTHVVDGQENALTLIETARLYEVQKYCSITNHMWAGYWFLANGDAWNRLPKEIRGVVERNVDEAASLERDDVEKLNGSLQPKLASQGLTFNTCAREPFRRKLRDSGFYGQWKSQYGAKAWSLLERSAGRLA